MRTFRESRIQAERGVSGVGKVQAAAVEIRSAPTVVTVRPVFARVSTAYVGSEARNTDAQTQFSRSRRVTNANLLISLRRTRLAAPSNSC
jgi:hypothetical protein